MAGANLQVKVGAEVDGFLGQMRRMDSEFTRVTRGVNDHGFALGKAQRALESFAAEASGANRTLAILSTAIADFGIGGVATTAAVLGIGLIAGAYNKLTEEARKAKEEQGKLFDALKQQFQPKTGPDSQTNKEFQAALQRRAELTRKLAQYQDDRDNPLVATSFTLKKVYDSRIEQTKKDLAETQTVIDRAYNGSITAMTTVTTTARNMDEVMAKATANLERYNALMKSLDIFPGTDSPTRDQRAAHLASFNTQFHDPGILYAQQHQLTENLTGQIMGQIPNASMPNVQMPFEGLSEHQKDTLRQLGVLTDHEDRNSAQLHDAIWGSAAQLGSVLVSALNVGGGGRGSQIGGSLGGTAGFAVGYIFGGGPVGGAIGSTIGNFIGSAIGGLFDHHKKAIDHNTEAVKALTQALVENAPNGFKVEPYRYDATVLPNMALRGQPGSGVVVYGDLHVHGVTDLKDLDRSVRKRSTRGGAPLLSSVAA
jgi:hypothetical protein